MALNSFREQFLRPNLWRGRWATERRVPRPEGRCSGPRFPREVFSKGLMPVSSQENRSAQWLTSKYNTMEGNQVGQERRTHSSVAAAVLVHPLPATDINTSQKSKSQSERINRCDLFGFQRLADLSELSGSYNMYKRYSLHLNSQRRENSMLPKTNFSSALSYVPHDGFFFCNILFCCCFFVNKSTYHFTPTQKVTRCLGVERFLSETLPSWNQLVTWQLLKCILRKS